MKVDVVQSDSDLQQLEPLWNELVAASELNHPFLLWEWCSTWWRHYGEGHVLAVLIARDGSQWIGLAPLFMERRKNDRGPGVMRFLGTGEVCSEYLGFLLRRGREQQAVHTLLDFLSRDKHLGGHELRLTHVPAVGHFGESLEAWLQSRRSRFRHDRTATSWQINLAGSWDEFLTSVGSKQRGRFRRAQRHVQDKRLEFHEVTSPADIEPAWEELKRLHLARWRASGEPGCFASARFSAFHSELLPVLWRRGMLCLTSLRGEDRTLAASYCLRHLGRIYFYQSGIDPNAMALGPGHSLRICELRRAIERGDRVFDFLSGDEEYKAQWATHRSEMVNWTVAGRGLVPRVRFGLETAAQWVKQSAQARLSTEAWATLRRWKRSLSESIPARGPWKQEKPF